MQKIEFKKIPQLDFRANEAFKTLRTNITFCGDNQRVVLFTSTVPNEGKTSVVFQLARSFAEDGKRVLLLDSDMRQSVLMGHYRVEQEARGLSHYLVGQDSAENVTYSTNIKNMNVIFSGPSTPNPAELLGSVRFEEMLCKERDNYDYILIDTPPLGSVIDAAIIARNADGVVIVVESGGVSYKMVQKVKEQLEKSGCPILGAVLNKVNQESKGYYDSYYGKYDNKHAIYAGGGNNGKVEKIEKTAEVKTASVNDDGNSVRRSRRRK
ncbi:MAG: CpsD/CapB family tyrosine-protein kinase [Clostridiales bacterium]|nr:CpsD/CapB family tyrosine-protein kinase [Clostridiales bacterium]